MVVDKSFTQGHTETTTETDSNGKVTITNKSYPDKYRLKLRKQVDGEDLEKWIDVEKEIFDKCPINSYYDAREELK